MLIDTHCHLDAPEFDVDRGSVVAKARAQGVEAIIIPSVSVSNFAAVRDCCLQFDHCFPAYGIHPLSVDHTPEESLVTMRRWLDTVRDSDHPPIAIGEIGLDRYIPSQDRERQAWFFRQQLKLACEHELPVLLHTRRAVEPLIQALRQCPVRGGIAHAFNGSLPQAEMLVRLGFKLGFGATLTYPGSTRIRHLASTLPLETIVLETDAPDMPPCWIGHGRNSPTELPRIAQVLAELRTQSAEDIASVTSRNAIEVLGFRAQLG